MNERIPTILKWLIPMAVIVFLCVGAVVLFNGVTWLMGRSIAEHNPLAGLFDRQPAGQLAFQDLYGQELGKHTADLMVVPDEDGENNRFALTGKLLEGGANFVTVAGLQIYTDENTTRVGTLANDALVRVEGTVQPDGRLVASRVMPADGLETFSGSLHGTVESIEGDTLVISGLNVRTNEQTSIDRSIEPGSAVAVDWLVLQDGEWLAIAVREDSERQVSDDENEQADDSAGEDPAATPPLSNRFVYVGRIEAIRPWNIAGRSLQVNDSTHLAEDLEVGDLVRAAGVIREDGSWVARSVTHQEGEDGQATAVIIGRIDDTDPWTINGLQLDVDENTRIGEELEEGDLVAAEVVLTAGADGENRWLARSIQAFDDQLRDNCFAVLDTVVHQEDGEIVLRNWPAAVLEDNVDVAGDIREGSPVLATVCAQGDERFTITRLVVLDLGDGDQDDEEDEDGNVNEDQEDDEDNNGNDNEDRDNENDNENGNKVTICHYPPGNRANAHTITVGESAVDAHLRNHGDTLGPCP